MRHVYYGAAVQRRGDPEAQLDAAGCTYHKLTEDELVEPDRWTQIADGKIVGWFQGRMEFGPRALGNRSILADPRRADMKDILNAPHQVPRAVPPLLPFDPGRRRRRVLRDRLSVALHGDGLSRSSRRSASAIPAVTHQDGTGRLQTVESDVNPLYWKLIRRFGDVTGVPVLLNTSFNENEPIVNTPAQAIDCFLRTHMDVLAIGSYLLLKTENERISENRAAFAETAR